MASPLVSYISQKMDATRAGVWSATCIQLPEAFTKHFHAIVNDASLHNWHTLNSHKRIRFRMRLGNQACWQKQVENFQAYFVELQLGPARFKNTVPHQLCVTSGNGNLKSHV